ncbi:MAG: aspartate aminotransferase family protein [Phycisphaerales bacterium]
MSNSADLIRRRENVVCPGVGRLSTLTAKSARGAILIDADGREFIDFAGGIGVMNVGHCDPDVVEAVRSQATQLLHTCFHVATYEPYIALCEKLVDLLPHGEATKAVLINTGAEAVENAVKIARQVTGRPGIICFTGAFHGRTLLSATLTSKVSYKTGCGPFMPEVYRLPFPKRDTGEQLSDEALSARELDRLRAAFKDTVAPQNVAGIIIELVQGEGGFYVAPTAYIQGLRELCNEYGIMLIFDEVQSGFARTGKWGAYQHYAVTPDISTWAKSMGGGLPISAVLGKASVMDRVNPGTLGGTYGGNPVSCAAALATIQSMQKHRLNDRAAHIGKTIRERFSNMAQRHKCITDVRGLGAMVAVEVHENGNPATPGSTTVKRVSDYCLEHGVITVTAGVLSNVIRVLCPLVITDEQLTRGLDTIEQAFAHAAGTHAQSPALLGARKG